MDLRGRNAALTLFGVEQDDGIVALGYHADKKLRAGRVFTDDSGKRYRLVEALPAGLRAVGLPDRSLLERPVRLEAA